MQDGRGMEQFLHIAVVGFLNFHLSSSYFFSFNIQNSSCVYTECRCTVSASNMLMAMSLFTAHSTSRYQGKVTVMAIFIGCRRNSINFIGGWPYLRDRCVCLCVCAIRGPLMIIKYEQAGR